MNKNSEAREQKPKRYERLQGKEWDLVKDNLRLLYTYKSAKGNSKGVEKISHWLNEDEKAEYLRSKEER